MKCIHCGKNEAVINGLCLKCYLKANPVIKAIKEFEVVICAHCNSFLIKNKWKHFDSLEDAVLETILSNISFNYTVTNVIIKELDIESFYRKPGTKSKARALITVFFKLNNKVMKEDYVLDFFVRTTVCNACKKNDTQYYESILQLRNVTQDVVKFCEARIFNNHSKGVFYSKKKKVRSKSTDKGRENWDYYVTSHNFLLKLSKELKKRFSGKVAVSRKQYSRDHMTSEMIYRGTVLFKQD